MKSVNYSFLMILFLGFCSEVSLLANENPQLIIESASSEMIKQLEKNQNEISEDTTVLIDIVEELLLPHFASNTISRKVLGKHARRITKEQKKQFSEAFRYYMIRFYTKAFATYSNQTFKFAETPDYKGKKKVIIRSHLIQPGDKPVAIDYKMQRSGKTWKIIDIKIAGISMVISNRSQFGSQISRDGIETVIAKLDYKNKKALTNE